MFLFNFTIGVVSSVAGGALWEKLSQSKWLPDSIEAQLPDSDEIAKSHIDESDWRLLEEQVAAAIQRRDFVTLDELVSSTSNNFVKVVISAVSSHLRGLIGDAYDKMVSLEDNGIIDKLPERVRFDILRHATRIYSISGYNEKSLEIYSRLRKTETYRQLDDIRRVQSWRDELNHCIQTAHSPVAYYNPSRPVLEKYDRVLKKCFSYVGNNLETAKRFHPTIGPAVICMKEYREWILFGSYYRDRNTANKALDRQKDAIEVLCERDRRLGPIRFSPLVSQHIRSRNWNEAWNILERQKQVWTNFDTAPAINNRYEFRIHKILYGIVAAFGFSEYELAQTYWKEARKILFETHTNRFQDVINNLLLEIADPVAIPATLHKTLQLNRRLLGKPGDYYFFGLV